MPEPLALQPAKRPPELLGLLANNSTTKWTVGTFSVASQAKCLGHVQDDGHRQAVILPGEFHQRPPRFRLNAGCVDDREGGQPAGAWTR